MAGPASAAPTYPSEREIDQARQAEAAATAAVTEIEQRLAAVTEQSDRVAVAAAQAVEAYNGVRFELLEAQVEEQAAAEHAEVTAAVADQALVEFGRVAAASYRSGGRLVTVGHVLGAGEAEQFFDAVGALRTVTRSHSVVYERAVETTAAASAAAEEAARAVDARQTASLQAEQAASDAATAVAEHEAILAATERQRQALVAELAAARGTTVALEQERHVGLQAANAARRERAALAAEAAPAAGSSAIPGATSTVPESAAPSAESAAPAAESAAPAAESAAPAAESAAPAPAQPAETSPPAAAPAPPPTAAQPPTAAPPQVAQSAADRAVAYARAQLGKSYQWGGAGPRSFDCSGLTMRAWEQGGVQLPHWSVAQAQQVTRVSYSQLAPGDLIFWSDNGQPSGTYHVGLYIGDGQMIHAPRPGKAVEIQNVFYWRTPSFYGRV